MPVQQSLDSHGLDPYYVVTCYNSVVGIYSCVAMEGNQKPFLQHG
jgi:hypothetical protein